MRTPSILLLCLLATGCGATSTQTPADGQPAHGDGAAPVGYGQARLQDEARQRPVWVDLWYPASPTARMERFRYGLAMGEAALDAAPAPGVRPLIVLSHGAGGSGTNYAWLAEYLAAEGYVIAAVNHHGESRAYGEPSLDPLAMFRSWLRPEDVHFAISSLLTHEQWGQHLQQNRVGGIGHSAGGHTLLALAGGEYEPMRMGSYCRTEAARADKGCEYARDLDAQDWAKVGRPPDGPPTTDPRLAALLLLEPAMGPSFIEASLQKITIPIHIVASEPGDFIPFAPHAGHFARLLPQVSLTTLDQGEGHFVYIAECSFPIDILGVPLCTDASGVDRGEVHQRLARVAVEFFEEKLPR
jgi:predicted dienelactone hydrolase